MNYGVPYKGVHRYTFGLTETNWSSNRDSSSAGEEEEKLLTRRPVCGTIYSKSSSYYEGC